MRHQIDAQLFKGAPSPSANGGWWRGLETALWKLFLGPRLTVTRTHIDAHDAHGWLAQIEGRKLFVLYPPTDAAALRCGEDATQSRWDPLRLALGEAEASGGGALRPHVAVVEPGEAILVPRGWWHYAVSLSRSTTAQCNFYGAGSNAGALVALVTEKLRDAKREK